MGAMDNLVDFGDTFFDDDSEGEGAGATQGGGGGQRRDTQCGGDGKNRRGDEEDAISIGSSSSDSSSSSSSTSSSSSVGSSGSDSGNGDGDGDAKLASRPVKKKQANSKANPRAKEDNDADPAALKNTRSKTATANDEMCEPFLNKSANDQDDDLLDACFDTVLVLFSSLSSFV